MANASTASQMAPSADGEAVLVTLEDSETTQSTSYAARCRGGQVAWQFSTVASGAESHAAAYVWAAAFSKAMLSRI